MPSATERLEAEGQRFFDFFTRDTFQLRTALFSLLVPDPQLARHFILGDPRKELDDRLKAYAGVSLWSGIVKAVYEVAMEEQNELKTGKLMGKRAAYTVPKAGLFWGVYGGVNYFMSEYRQKDDPWNTFAASEAAIATTLATTRHLVKLPSFTFVAVGFALLKNNESYSDSMWGDPKFNYTPLRYWDSRHYEKGYTGKPFQGIPKDENF